TLTNALVADGNTLKLDGASSALTDNAGISLSTGTITGLGSVTGAVTASGAASIVANGGTLEMKSGITDSGNALSLKITGAGDKPLLDAASAANTLTFNGASGTLELNTSGTLTVATALAIGSGTVKLDGASSSLTDNAGLSISTGTITGLGSV